MNPIEEVAERFSDLLANSKPIPLTSKVSVNRQDFEDLIYELRLSVPDSIKEAEDVIDNCHDYVNKAQDEADYILESAKIEADKLVSTHEIFIRASDEAEKLVEQTNEEINNSYSEALKIVDEILADVSERIKDLNNNVNEQYTNTLGALKGYHDEVYEMRKDLREGQS